MEDLNKLNQILEISNSETKIILNNILSHTPNNKKNIIDISSNVYNDTLIDNWIEKLPILDGGKILIKNIIHNPINDKSILEERQKSYISDNTICSDITILKKYEKDILWAFILNDELNEDYSINLLYFTNFLICKINTIEPILDLYHIYKIYCVPLLTLAYPISIIFGPLYYINKHLNINMSIKDYLKILYSFLNIFLKRTGNFKIDFLKIVSLIMYVFLYLYGTYQSLELSYIAYKTKEKLQKKMKNLVEFITNSINIINKIPHYIIMPYLDINTMDDYNQLRLTTSMSDIYNLWKNKNIKEKIKSLLKIIYTIDVINSISRLRDKKNWCLPSYKANITKMWNMKNPLLNNNQIGNPSNLSKSIILTGPNAAGKTTYVKSILSNIILALTFGITNCVKSDIILYDAINSFMRITDVLGEKSYFEVETEYCSSMINKAIKLTSENKKGLFLMDEPMHSTPPTEGMATAYAVSEFIGKLPGLNLIITTHFHKLIILENSYPDNFINLSVEAIKNVNGGFDFPYKIIRGSSKQCIALELLDKQKFPQCVINSAIEMKNKICSEIYSK